MIQVTPPPNYRLIATFTTVVLGTIAVLLITWRFIDILALLLVSLAVAAMVRTPVKWLTALRVPLSLATIIIYLIGVAIIVAIGWFVVPHVVAEVQRLAQDISHQYDAFYQSLTSGQSMTRLLARRLPAPGALNAIATSGASAMQSSMLVAIGNIVDIVAQSLLVIVISIYWSADSIRFERLWLSLLPPEHRTRARAAWRQIDTGLGAYMRSEAAQCLLTGAILTPIFFLLGLPYPVTTALFVSLAWLLPLVGGVLAVLPVALMAFFVPLPTVLIAVLITVVVLWFMEFVLERRLYVRERYGSVLVLLLTIIIVEALGVVGLIIAPPLATAVQIAINEWLRRDVELPIRPVVTPTTAAATQQVALTTSATQTHIAQIRQRLEEAQQRLVETGTQSPRTQSLIGRLTELVNEAETTVSASADGSVVNGQPAS